ncbi:hypothetical protein N657DRAFT_50111 [Parathielavia appendiculata]|uniref:Uncharacterized protein n=1 Tax=Parathielavia appendiculata TaxID=2587402 RepID=A0AAN6UA28_9PEZI|nr:hypothetical protein N657DRAFT_50111 [Parathielavia appendiculata]
MIRGVAKKAAGGGGAVPASNIFAQFMRITPGREAAQSAGVAPLQLTDSSAPETSHQAAVQDTQNLQSELLGPTRNTVPSVVTSFGRETARSVFVANPNWKGGARGVRDILAFAPTQRGRLVRPPTSQDQKSSRAVRGSVRTRDDLTFAIPSSRAATGSIPAREDFRLAIPPIRGMNSRKHLRSQPNSSTIRQEESEEPALKRARPPAVSPLAVPAPTRDRQKRIAAREQRKRNGVIWDSLVAPMDGVEEGGGPATQPDPLPVESTARADLPFIVEEEEEEEEEEEL